MAKPSKATKKFQSKHLKHTIEHRREVQRHNKKALSRKKKSSNDETDKPSTPQPKEVFNDMSVEDFMEGGFEVPKEKKSSKKAQQESESEDESSESEDEEAMKHDLKNLAEKDPEFYKYLEENDKGLLDFEAVNPMDAMSDDEDASELEAEEAEETKEQKDETSNKIEITLELVKEWSTKLQKPTPKLIRNVAIAFKAAVNINRANEEDYKYLVTDPEAFNALMVLTLQDLPAAIQKLVKYKVNASTGARTIPQKNQHVSQISSILKSHAGSYITLLHDITNTETAALVLSSLQELFPYYLSHRRLLKQLLAGVVNVWATTPDVETQIATFAFLNNVSREFSSSLLETVLKLTYSSFLQNCRKTNVYNMPMINVCKNSAAELFGIDEKISYQIGYEYIRQLAIHLRNSMNATSNAKDGYKTVYNWQYCHSLDFWSRVLTQFCNPEVELKHKNKESPLRLLIYPLVQVTLGTIRLIPTAQFFPLRFYLLRSLIRLSQSTGVYIPIYPLLSEVLTSTAFTKSPKRTNLAAFDFENNIKVNQAYLGTRTYQDGLSEQFVELASEFFVLHCKSIAFPELATPAILSLRRFIKKSKNIRFNKQLQQLVEKLNSNATYIIAKRANVEYGPSNRAEVNAFLSETDWQKTPLGQYVVVQRKSKETKLQLLKQAMEDEAESKNQKERDEDDDEAMDALAEESDGSEADMSD